MLHRSDFVATLVSHALVLMQVRLEIDEDTEALFGPSGILGLGGGQALRRAPPRQKAELGVESLKALVARVKGIILWFKMAKNGWVCFLCYIQKCWAIKHCPLMIRRATSADISFLCSSAHVAEFVLAEWRC